MTSDEYAKLVSKNIRRIAYEKGKSQADISKDLRISKATISSWMNGTRVPRMEKIDALCRYFNCRRSDIMEDHSPGQVPGYYIDDDVKEIARFLFQNPEYRPLFDAYKSIRKEDIPLIKEIIDRLSRN